MPAVVWLLGYAASWGTKLLIADCFAGKLFSAWEAVALRSSAVGAAGKHFDRIEAVGTNFREFFTVNRMIFIFIAVLTVIVILKQLYKVYCKQQKFDFNIFAGFCSYSLIPLAFIFVLANHSQIHAFMVYRNITLVVIALFLALTTCFSKKEENPND